MSKQITDQILEFATRPCGIGSADIPEIDVADLSARCCALVRQRRLFRAGGGYGKTRYFATQEAADAYNAEHKQAPKAVAKCVPVTKASWAKNAEVVITSNTKVTICPPWKPRFQAIETPHVYSGNQRGRVSA